VSQIVEIIRRRSAPLEPQPTHVEPRLPRLAGIRGVAFDIYGTLFISGSGDVGVAAAQPRAAAFAEALAAAEVEPATGDAENKRGEEGVAALTECIRRHHAAARQQGVDYPEVEIVEVWREVLAGLGGELSAAPSSDDALRRLAIEYETRVNPVWPMPAADQCLRRLAAAGKVLGIVSNAQFFTRELFPALLGATTNELGFAAQRQIYSYEHLRAKPGEFLYQLAVAAYDEAELAPQEVLYVGNDMLNDITPAARLGFRTALFAGDARSLRLREDDPRVAGVTPDAILTNLGQLEEIIA